MLIALLISLQLVQSALLVQLITKLCTRLLVFAFGPLTCAQKPTKQGVSTRHDEGHDVQHDQ